MHISEREINDVCCRLMSIYFKSDPPCLSRLLLETELETADGTQSLSTSSVKEEVKGEANHKRDSLNEQHKTQSQVHLQCE